MMQSKLETAISRMQQADTLDVLESEILQLRDLFEVEHVAYHSVNSGAGQYVASSYPADWLKRYAAQRYYRTDPVVLGSYRRFEPVDWKQLDWSGRAEREFLGEAVEAGVGPQGLSMPIHGPQGQFAVFTVSHRASDEAWARQATANLSSLVLAGHFANRAALRLSQENDEGIATGLSPRETDALTFLALGYNRAQASEKLSISEHTLRVYVESARFKLGAANTTHAVARGIARGLLVF